MSFKFDLQTGRVIEFGETVDEPAQVFYSYTRQGIWCPDTVCKPFLKPAIDEVRSLQKEWARLRSLFTVPAEDK